MANTSFKDALVSRTLLVILCVNTMFWSCLGGVLSLWDRRGNLAHLCNRHWAKLNLLLGGFQVEVEGVERIDPLRPYVIVSNHQALFDIVMLLGLLPLQFRFVSRKEIFRVPFLGWAMRFARYIEFDRHRLRGVKRTFGRSAEVLRQGISVMVFPEGTRSRDGRLRPFRKGPFQLALDCGVPVLPVTLLGTQRAISQKDLHIVPCRVRMIVSRPIETASYPRDGSRKLMEEAYRVIRETFDRFHRGYYPFHETRSEAPHG